MFEAILRFFSAYRLFRQVLLCIGAVIACSLASVNVAGAANLRVMTTGLGEGGITGTGISCGLGGSDCNESFADSASPVTLTATPGSGAVFAGWGGDCPDTVPATPANQCSVSVDVLRSVRATFNRAVIPPEISDFTPEGIQTYLDTNTSVDTPAEFVAALPQDFRENWILMTRSESLQTGMALMPRILLVSADAKRVFTLGVSNPNFDASDNPVVEPPHSSYPGSHPLAVEYMQWDPGAKNFRFHEIVIAGVGVTIPPMGNDMDPGSGVTRPIKARMRGVSADDQKCFACHSTRNVINLNPMRDGPGTTPGTTGISPQTVKFKNKPNWDTYDSWGGMTPFNRDRIYKNTVEAATFRKIFNLWTWQDNEIVRGVIDELALQPAGVPTKHQIDRFEGGGVSDGQIWFGFDRTDPNDAGEIPSPVTIEGTPTGTGPNITYKFDRREGLAADQSEVRREGVNDEFVTLHHSASPANDEGRGVQLFDLLGGADSQPNAIRIADEMVPTLPITDYYATGGYPIDVRPFALAITDNCIRVGNAPSVGNTQTITDRSTELINKDSFFEERNGLDFNGVYDDTRRRQQSLTRRKADNQRATLDRDNDVYVYDPPPLDFFPNASTPTPHSATDRVNGLIREHGAATAGGGDQTFTRLRQEVFRRPGNDPLTSPRPHPDETAMGRIYPDREDDSTDGTRDNTAKMALFRYYLEPLGVSVDKWSMNVRGRSRAYNFADVFGNQVDVISSELKASLGVSAISCTTGADNIMARVDAQLVRLPVTPDDAPTYTDLQRIYNKSCIECHGGLGYPPYHTYGTALDFSENETPDSSAVYPQNRRLGQSHSLTQNLTAMPICEIDNPGCGPAERTNVSNSYLYARITDNGNLVHPYNPGQPHNFTNPDDSTNPDIADERCPSGVMPCGGPPLSKTDIESVRRWIIGGRSTYTEGDPHIKTVDGTSYDFQSAGEFTLLRDEGMELQARQTAVTTAGPLSPNPHTGLSSCVSLNTAVAMQVGGHRITYQPLIDPDFDNEGSSVRLREKRRLVLRIDGKPVTLTGAEIPLSRGGRITQTSVEGGINVHFPGGTGIVVTPQYWEQHQLWYMNINVRHARAKAGIMGSISPGNWLPALSDGSFLGQRPANLAQRQQDLYKTFADSWRVDTVNSLFDYEQGLSPQSFVVDDWPVSAAQGCFAPPQPGGTFSTAPPTAIAQGEAEHLCNAVVDPERRYNCVQDVMATGEAGFADAYVATETIEQQPIPAMAILVTPADNAILFPGKVDFNWDLPPFNRTIDVTYRHCIWNSHEQFDMNRCVKLVNPENPLLDLLPPVIKDLLTGLHPSVCVALVIILLIFALYILIRFRFKGLLFALFLAAIAAFIWFCVCLDAGEGARSTSLQNLEPERIYFWKVVAISPEGFAVESRTRQFTLTE